MASVVPFKQGEALDEEPPPEAKTNEEFLRLMGLSVEDILREGQKALFADLVGKVRAGEANHQEKAILRNILKDNGLTLGIPPEAPAQSKSPEDFPEFEEPDYD